MGLSKTLDITSDFNADGIATLDVGQWDNVVAQFVTPVGAISFLGSNDGGAITGITDGNALLAKNFTAIQGTDESTGTAATSTSVTSNYKFSVTHKFVRFSGGTATQILIFLYKIDL